MPQVRHQGPVARARRRAHDRDRVHVGDHVQHVLVLQRRVSLLMGSRAEAAAAAAAAAAGGGLAGGRGRRQRRRRVDAHADARRRRLLLLLRGLARRVDHARCCCRLARTIQLGRVLLAIRDVLVSSV